MREEGYYWVKYERKWIIAYWTVVAGRGYWEPVNGYADDMRDDHFKEIDENRIVRSI